MKFNPIPLLTTLFVLGIVSSTNAQKEPIAEDARYRLHLLNADFVPAKNISADQLTVLNRRATRINKQSFTIIQFENIPSVQERELLKQSGVELLDYIPNNAYTATIKDSLSITLLKRVKARAVVDITPQQKMLPDMAKGIFPPHAIKIPGTVDLYITYPKSFTYEMVSDELKKRNFDVLPTDWQKYNVMGVRVASNRVNELASLSFIEFLQPAPKQDEPLNNKSIANARANVLQSSLPGGRNLHGEGVVVGSGDESDPLLHMDFSGRLINRMFYHASGHGLHTMATTLGAGIIEEKYTGYAPKATVISTAYSNVLVNVPTYVQDYGMVLTNNSYGNVDGCAFHGIYDIYSRIMDQMAFDYPNLENVFSAGNSGNQNCSPYPLQFRTVFSSYQTAKNVITVGNTTELNDIWNGFAASSKGPVRDGRIKPEISAQGQAVRSAWTNNAYIPNNGTSMAAPAVTGGLALMYQRYRQLHGNANPKNGLMKALLLNGATDNGNAGPDYSYGFGNLNLLRAVTMLEQNNYINDSVDAGAVKTTTITVPPGANISKLKVMLYWNDAPAAVFASHTLVNDLDLKVTGPGIDNDSLPYVLDTIPANVTNPATRGVDHINNVEQVVIDTVLAGTYTVTVKGTTIPLTPRHEYFLVFDTIPVSTVLTYPVGGEHLVAKDSIYISWDAYGNSTNDFTCQYSLDNGATWTTINATPVAANLRLLKWYLPDTSMAQVKVKLIHNGTGIERISESFVIMKPLTVTLAPVQCEGYISLNWNAVTGATDYEVMMLKGSEMVHVADTTGLTYNISGLSKDSLYWVTVRPRIGGVPGKRALAISRQPNTGTCTGNISDKDLKVDAIVSPATSGRKLTSTELSNSVAITIRIKNLDDVATTGNVPVAYKIGANPIVNESITTPNIAAGATFDYTFVTTADLSAVGTYPLTAIVSYPGDTIPANDTVLKIYKQLDNPFIDLDAAQFIDDIESATIKDYLGAQTGLDGLDRYDFVTTSAFGRVRPFVNSDIAYSGSKALTVDADRRNGGIADSLKGTFNLQGFDINTDDVRFDFQFKHHGQLFNNANKVWIRGDDTKPWIQVYDLYANQTAQPGIFKKSPSIEVSDILAANSQTLTSSFQVRWGQWGTNMAADNLNAAGYTFDDIHLYLVTDDIQMVSIDTPIVSNCGLNSTTPIRVSVRNSSNSTVTNVPVTFKADGNAPVTEFITSIPGNGTVSYTFTATADFSALGSHTLVTWTDFASDSFHDNDTARLALNNLPIINSFPYLQNFEAGAGSWFADGRNTSWEYGTPASPKINRAASGTKAWKTTLTGNYNDDELSYLYSPCFDISGLTNPTLSLSIALDLEDCGGTLCDGAYVEYSADGITWTRLGAAGSGTNWYNKTYAGNNVWSVQDYTRWHVATIPLPTGLTRLRLRFVIASDPFVSFEGIAVDDIHIYNNPDGIYTGPPNNSSSVNQAVVNGTNWIDFKDGGKLITSINPNGQDLGSTNAQAFINTGAIRKNSLQYIHNRNITIKPTNISLADSATVRFYFLDTETEALINATGCAGCSKPRSAYELGVTKYSDADDNIENGTLTDNVNGTYYFYVPTQVVKVPFDKGYYAEFKVKDFSEFWLNNGGPNNNMTLPVELVSFTATKQSNLDVLTEWVVASEYNTDKYEVQVAKGNEDYRTNRFITLGTIGSTGNSTTTKTYQFTDVENNKSGVRYYRLKITDHDGRITYSGIRPVVFNEEVKWQIYPNPSSGIFNLVYQASDGETVGLKVYDINGRQVKQSIYTANGFVQKAEINLAGNHFVPGMYMVEVTTGKNGGQKHIFRLLKQ